jgi:hypothetical protein
MRGETVTVPPCVGEASDDDMEGIFLRIGSSTSTELSIEKLLSDLVLLLLLPMARMLLKTL